MMNVIINEKLYDADYVSNYTLGLSSYGSAHRNIHRSGCRAWTGISADDIRSWHAICHGAASGDPRELRVQRSQNGGSGDARHCNAALHYWFMAEAGGGLQLSTSGSFYLNMQALDRPDLMQRARSGDRRIVNMSELGQGAEY